MLEVAGVLVVCCTCVGGVGGCVSSVRRDVAEVGGGLLVVFCNSIPDGLGMGNGCVLSWG